VTSTAWQRVATGGGDCGRVVTRVVAIRMSLEIFVLTSICSHRSPDGGGFPGDVHRLAAGGYGRAVTGKRLRGGLQKLRLVQLFIC
jgi:hypothetical protein